MEGPASLPGWDSALPPRVSGSQSQRSGRDSVRFRWRQDLEQATPTREDQEKRGRSWRLGVSRVVTGGGGSQVRTSEHFVSVHCARSYVTPTVWTEHTVSADQRDAGERRRGPRTCSDGRWRWGSDGMPCPAGSGDPSQGSGCVQLSSPGHLTMPRRSPPAAPGWWVWGGLARRGCGDLGCGALARPRPVAGPASSRGVSVVGRGVWWELRAWWRHEQLRESAQDHTQALLNYFAVRRLLPWKRLAGRPSPLCLWTGPLLRPSGLRRALAKLKVCHRHLDVPFFFFNWSKVDFQRCAGFRRTAQWFSFSDSCYTSLRDTEYSSRCCTEGIIIHLFSVWPWCLLTSTS